LERRIVIWKGEKEGSLTREKEGKRDWREGWERIGEMQAKRNLKEGMENELYTREGRKGDW
jgi:hypothetical protein